MYIRGSQSFPPPSRILLIQLRRIGDTLLGSPAIRALHQHFPHAKIDFIAESPSEEILRGHPAIDRLLIAPRHSIQQTISFICKVRQQKYDWAIDFMSNPRSAQFAFFSGAKLRVGLDRRGRRWAFTHHVVEEAEDKDAYAVDLRLKILQLLGVPSAGRHMEIFCDQVCLAEKQQAETAIAKLNGKGSIITVATGSGNPAKRYPANLTAQVIETLTQEGCQVVLTSGPGETIYADEILKQLKQPVMHLADARVPLLAALYRKCQLYIGPDSAPKHIAIACGLPTVTIFGPGRPSNWNDAENPRSVMLVAPCDVRPNCVESECARRACLHKIEPQAVVETARILLM